MPYLRGRIYRPDMTAPEPDDPVVVCQCTKCRQDVYLQEYTFEDDPGSRLCRECFESLIEQRMRDDLPLLAMELGYEVVQHEG